MLGSIKKKVIMTLKLITCRKENGPNMDPGHLFPLWETWFVEVEKNNKIQNIVVKCINSDGTQYVPTLDHITVDGQLVDSKSYRFIKQDLQNVKVVIPALTFAILENLENTPK